MRAWEFTRPISEPRMLVTPATYATISRAGAEAFRPSMKREPRGAEGMRIHFESNRRRVREENIEYADRQRAGDQSAWNVASWVFRLFRETGRVLPTDEEIDGERKARSQTRETSGQV